MLGSPLELTGSVIRRLEVSVYRCYIVTPYRVVITIGETRWETIVYVPIPYAISSLSLLVLTENRLNGYLLARTDVGAIHHYAFIGVFR